MFIWLKAIYENCILSLTSYKVPYHMDENPSYLIVAGLVFTPLSEAFIEWVLHAYLVKE
jgi:PDZ domain